MSKALVEAYLDALKSMRDSSHEAACQAQTLMAEDMDGPVVEVSAARLTEYLLAADANDLLPRQLGLAMFD